MIASLLLALRFLTIIPVPGREATGRGALGRAAAWFPGVGLALGAALAGLDRALGMLFPPLLSALLAVAAWKVITGGIHLDGLADCLDGLGGGDREHRLAIMRDSRIGTFGALGLSLCLLMDLVALAETPPGLRWRALLLAPAVGRLAPLLVAPRFAVATPLRGAGAAFVAGMARWAGPVQLVAVLGLAVWLLGTWGAAASLAALLVVLGWSALVARRLGGLTGDVLGSGVELAELTVLLAGASLAYRGAL